ncbi:MAG: inositol monophosphatase [Alphaproteobacteria bacterium]|nr:MAG: inositol monophosphatase [Alphaproteobacteria bacterium]
MPDLDGRLAVAASLALSAGAYARDCFRDPDARQHRFKGPQDYLTEVDGAVEARIRKGLGESFPEDAIIGEEAGGTGAEACWVIDPIDGTANFARGLARWCISIGFVVGQRAVLGAVYDPMQDELFLARSGNGATLNGRPIRVATTPDLAHGIVETGWNPRLDRAQHLVDLDRVIGAGAAIRRLGSGTLGLTDVACGRSDAYFQRHIWSWDVAAALAIASEAGAWTNDFFADDGLIRGNTVLAATPGCASALVSLLLSEA